MIENSQIYGRVCQWKNFKNRDKFRSHVFWLTMYLSFS